VFVTGLNKPWDIAFLPNGTMLYTENDGGTVSAYISAGDPRHVLDEGAANDVIDDALIGAPSGEGGVMGIAVHPAFGVSNMFIYVCYTTATDNRVVRFTLDAAVPTAMSAKTPIVTGMQRAGAHNGCRIRFQPGANPAALFITMGDATVGSNPQSNTVLNGKVLRVTDTGAPYPGNPLGRRWFTKGHRNPQGITFHPFTKTPYTTEHGPDKNDEINKLTVGGNGGWDPVPGYDQGVSMTDVVKFPGAMRPLWRSGDGGTIAPSGMTFVTGANWRSWSGSIVVAMLKNSELRLFLVNSVGNISGHVQVPDSTGTRLRSPVLGPDGALYVATDVASPGGAIWRVTAA
jgi:glucose/arabinose dehydrogenase